MPQPRDRRDDMQPSTQSVHAAVVVRDIIDEKRARRRFRRREIACERVMAAALVNFAALFVDDERRAREAKRLIQRERSVGAECALGRNQEAPR
jgi:hypothetical protein